MTVPDRQFITNAVIALLVTGTGKAVGDPKAPLSTAPPYSVVFSIPGGGYWGAALVGPEADADFVYQVDAVGLRRSQAEWMADRVRRTILARPSSGSFQVTLVPPTGWAVADRVPDGGPGGVQVDGSPPHEVFSVAERFVLRVVPA